MKNIFLAGILLAVSLFGFSARADGGPTGVGFIIGDPTGLSVKHWLTETSAIDAAFAWTLNGYNAADIQFDYLAHVPNLIRIGDAEFALHYGIGGALVFANTSAFGVRVPVGLSHRMESSPIDFFFEVAGLMFLSPSTDFVVQAGIGGRYYL